jgi:phosphoglycolate phosphatase
VFFDLDGTLIDHFETLYRCYEHALTAIGLPVPSREVVRRSVGGSMEVTMRRFVSDEAQHAAAAKAWRAFFAAHYLDDVKLMPGARELVGALHARGLRLGVLTNKIGEQSRGICRHLGLESMLDLVLGANDTAFRKPQREFSALALERLGTAAAETIVIGDSPFDIEAAHVVGMRAVCVTTGTHNADELRAATADAVFPNFAELGAAVFDVR